MNSPPPFTLRIRTEQDQDIDWMVQPDEITFHQALVIFAYIHYYKYCILKKNKPTKRQSVCYRGWHKTCNAMQCPLS